MFFHANRWEFEHEDEPLDLGLRSYSFGQTLLGASWWGSTGEWRRLFARLSSLGPVSWLLASISVRTSNTSQVNIVLDKAWKFHKYVLSCRYSLKVQRYDLSCSHFWVFERLASRHASQPRCFQLEPAPCRRFHETWNYCWIPRLLVISKTWPRKLLKFDDFPSGTLTELWHTSP